MMGSFRFGVAGMHQWFLLSSNLWLSGWLVGLILSTFTLETLTGLSALSLFSLLLVFFLYDLLALLSLFDILS